MVIRKGNYMADENKKMLIRVPLKRTRINLKTGITEEHYFTEEEKEILKNGGKVVLGNDAVWQPVTNN